MLACVDVDYRPLEAFAACLLFEHWSDATEAKSHVQHVPSVAPYVPGQFYLRELPCLLAVLSRVTATLDAVVVDGYVWLSASGRRGLGAHLYDALGGRVPVIGVAKTSFSGAPSIAVLRGSSRTPLHVTSVGIDAPTAAGHIAGMHGAHRVPTLLKRVDRLARDAA